MKKSRIMQCFLLLALSFAVLFSHVESAKALDSRSGYKFDFVPHVPGRIQNGGSVDIIDINFSGQGDGFLGCTGFNFDNVFRNIIDSLNPSAIAQQIQDYFITSLANFLLTQIYSSPALAAIFDSLEAFGNARLNLLQARCNVNEIKAKTKPARDEAMREAQNKCLAENDTVACLTTGTVEFKQSLDTVLDSAKYNGSFYEVLGGEESLGELVAFIPNVRWCVNTNCNNGRYRSRPPLPASTIFATIQGVSSESVFQGVLIMKQLRFQHGDAAVEDALDEFAQVQQAQAVMLAEAKVPENFIRIEHLNVLDLGVDSADNVDDFLPDFMGGNSGTSHEQKFLDFINCRESTDFGVNYINWLQNAFPTADFPDNIGNDTVDVSQLFPGASPTDSPVYQGLLGQDVPNAAKLMGKAMACIHNHALNLSPYDYMALSKLSDDEAKAISGSVGNRIAFLATEAILRFLKEELLQEWATRAFNKTGLNENSSTASDNDTDLPPHALDAVRMLVDSIENRIAALKAVNEGQQTFARMMARLEALREAQKERSDRSRRLGNGTNAPGVLF